MKKFIQMPLNDDQYEKKEYLDKQWICLHHTVSDSAKGSAKWWNMTAEKVGTPYMIERNGDIVQLFDDKYFAWHLGLKNIDKVHNTYYNANTVGIELINWGPLTENSKLEKFEQSYRGSQFWQTYTDQQYYSLAELIQYLWNKYPKIGHTINDSLEFDIGVLKTPQIFSHRNVNTMKTDVSPAFDFKKLNEKLLWIGAL